MKIKRKLNPKQGKRLKECIEAKKMTQKELSKKSGYSEQYISYIINEKKNMSLESARAFAKILDVDAEYLLCETEYKTEANRINKLAKEFDAFVDDILIRDEMAKKAVLSLLKVYGISISESFEEKLDGEELDNYTKFYSNNGMIPLNPHKLLVRVQVDNEYFANNNSNNKQTIRNMNANEIFEFVERILDFVEFQAIKIKDKIEHI